MQTMFISPPPPDQQDFWHLLINIDLCITDEPCGAKPVYAEVQSTERAVRVEQFM